MELVYFFFFLIISISLLILLFKKKDISFDIKFQNNQIGDDVEDYINFNEEKNKKILPWAKKNIVWYNKKNKNKTKLSIIYIHGFSASLGEIRPVPEILAKELKANLFFTRLSGHGLIDEFSLKDVDGKNWYYDIEEAFEVGKKIGDKILVIGTSFGCTLATEYLSKNDNENLVLGNIFISPCFGVSDWRLSLGKYYWSKTLFRLIYGEKRIVKNRNFEEKKWWSNIYPIDAIINLIISIEKIWKSDFSTISSPALFIFSLKDKWIDVLRIKKAAKLWGGQVSLVTLDTNPNIDNGNSHVILGEIKAAEQTQLGVEIIMSWLNDLMKSS